MLLMIDNYDSFTYTLVRYFRELGQTVRVVRHDALSVHDLVKWRPDYVVISPGPGLPDQTGCLLNFIRACYQHVPILGVCLGHQALVQAFGGSLLPAREVVHGKTSPVFHQSKKLFQQLPSPMLVARYHSWVVDRRSLPDEWELLAWTQSEGCVDEVMAIAHRKWPVFGVQFHPESILSECGASILQAFLSIASGWVDDSIISNR